ncbi:7tm Odorant receptor [Popillia japonica]|uniref:7tm Odorant receptor n=1 Tax=Popillia japonica TaxID=7064 RepID=A0AAW1LSV5_POPJA
MLNRLETILVALIIIVGVLYGVAPLFFSDKPYILDVGFTIDSGVIKTVVLLSQYYFVALSASVIVAYDVIYISSCCYVLIQIKLLHFIIARLEAATSRRKFINCIQHHIFILNLISRIRRQYSFLFLMQYMMTITSICNQLLQLANIRTSILDHRSITAALYLVYMFLEFGVYCVPAEQVGSGVLHLSDVIFSSQWYQLPVQWRSEIIFIMMIAQRETYNVTMGGIYKVNMETLVQMIKTTFTFHTFVNNINVLKK